MRPGYGDRFFFADLPRTDMNIGNSASEPRDAALNEGVSHMPSAKIVDGQIDRFRYARLAHF